MMLAFRYLPRVDMLDQMHIKLWRQWCTAVYTDVLLEHMHIVTCVASKTNRLFLLYCRGSLLQKPEAASQKKVKSKCSRWCFRNLPELPEQSHYSISLHSVALQHVYLNRPTHCFLFVAQIFFMVQDSLPIKITFICNVLRHIQPGKARTAATATECQAHMTGSRLSASALQWSRQIRPEHQTVWNSYVVLID